MWNGITRREWNFYVYSIAGNVTDSRWTWNNSLSTILYLISIYSTLETKRSWLNKFFLYLIFFNPSISNLISSKLIRNYSRLVEKTWFSKESRFDTINKFSCIFISGKEKQEKNYCKKERSFRHLFITFKQLNCFEHTFEIGRNRFLQTGGWRFPPRFNRMCSNKINGICRACKFYGRTGGIERWRGKWCLYKRRRKTVNRQVASGKVDRVKRRLIVAFARFWLSALQWALPITIDATTKTGLSSPRRWTLREKRIDAFTTCRIENIFHVEIILLFVRM